MLVVNIRLGGLCGRGEAVPYPHFGEDADQTLRDVNNLATLSPHPSDWTTALSSVGTRAASCALDCAFWDLAAKISDQPVWALARLPRPEPVESAYTISLDEPGTMAKAARKAGGRPLLKVKLGAGRRDGERLAKLRAAAPDARLIVDANEGWSLDDLQELAPICADHGVELIEQPLPASRDEGLAHFASPVPLCADESFHRADDLARIVDRYQAVNVKLDKAGGLTEAIRTTAAAQQAGLDIMLGCMVATSLAIAPAFLLASRSRWVDLDGPLLLAADRQGGVRDDGRLIHPPDPALWGGTAEAEN